MGPAIHRVHYIHRPLPHNSTIHPLTLIPSTHIDTSTIDTHPPSTASTASTRCPAAGGGAIRSTRIHSCPIGQRVQRVHHLKYSRSSITNSTTQTWPNTPTNSTKTTRSPAASRPNRSRSTPPCSLKWTQNTSSSSTPPFAIMRTYWLPIESH